MSLEGRRFRIAKAVTFEAAHFMGAQPEGHPYRNVHGHSFRIEAVVAGEVQAGEQWVEDFARLAEALEAVAARLDHRLLNEVEGLDVPTLERLCGFVARALKPDFPGLAEVTLARPSLDESCTLTVD